MSPNQRVLDFLLRRKVRLLGFAKHVADRIVAWLDATEPKMRSVLLEIFGTNTLGPRLATRLRDAEARVLGIRSAGWSRSVNELVSSLVELAKKEPAALKQVAGSKLNLPPETTVVSRVHKVLVAGHKIKDWMRSMRDADLRRVLGQLRIAVLAGEDVNKILGRLTGKLSAVANAAKHAVRSIAATAVTAVSDAVRSAIMEINVGREGARYQWELWISILDNRTTSGCRKLHHKRFRVGEGIRPGYHFFCRSERVPIDDDGGDVANESYTKWVSRQPQSFRKYAGEGTEFSESALRPLTLKQIEE